MGPAIFEFWVLIEAAGVDRKKNATMPPPKLGGGAGQGKMTSPLERAAHEEVTSVRSG